MLVHKMFKLIVVRRLRDAEAAAAKAAAELTKKQAKRMADIAAVLAEEEKEYRKRLARQECLQQVNVLKMAQVPAAY